MFKIFPVIIAILLLSACNDEPYVPPTPGGGSQGIKSPETVGQPLSAWTKGALHIAQSNHITMIVRHVALMDSSYVQTLTEDDFSALGFTQEEIDFSNHYISVLNEQLKEDTK